MHWLVIERYKHDICKKKWKIDSRYKLPNTQRVDEWKINPEHKQRARNIYKF